MSSTLLRATARRLFEGVLDWPFPRPAAKALVRRDEGDETEYLFVRQSWSDGDRWLLPGGGIEAGEDPREAAVREVREETGLSVVAESPVDAYSFGTGMGPHVAVVVPCTVQSGDLTVEDNPDDEPIVEARWMTAAETRALSVPDDLAPVLDRVLE